ncbi:MAG: OmpA family protein [Desulfobacterales bacterium]|jgi:outer membrane protein OmpA-like peptidoglycan-associated protein
MNRMLGRKANFASIFLPAIILTLLACTGQQLEVKPISKSENPQELINQLDNDIALAYKNQLNVLAPTWFGKSNASLVAAKKGLEEGDQLSKILDDIATGRAQLVRAEEIARVSKTTLPNAIKARNLARDAGATTLGREYTDAEERFLKLTRAIEDNDLNYAQRNQAGVAGEFRDLELRAIKVRTIGEVRRLMEDAEDKDLQKIAPRSYLAAEKKLAEADAFITQNPYQEEKMHRLAAEALFMAQRLHVIAEQSQKFEAMEPEQVALWAEGFQYQASESLGAPDMRNQPFDQQHENILETISVQRADLDFMIENSKKLQEQVAGLEGKTLEEHQEKERLLAEKRFNEKLSSIQHFFKPEEAEVYKKQNQIIIRLKTMQFPVGKSVIMPENYDLLSKVQRAIRTFGEPDVIIGGHTDSTGSEEVNEHLSQQRADAVRQYFVANETLPYEKIIAVGYGSMRPIASNANESGRAMNRRIDVIIAPEAKQNQ